MAATSDSGRLEAFSDGVLAVAITLLALNLAVEGPGHGPLGHQLVDRWPVMAAYLVSFFTVGIIWVNHHALFKNLTQVDRTLLFLNLLLLFFVVVIPFATSTMASYLRSGGADAHLAAALYGVVLEGMSLSFGAIFLWSIRQGHLPRPLKEADARRAQWRFGIGSFVYLAAAALAFVSAPLALGLYGIIACYYIFEQTPGQAAEQTPGPAHPESTQTR
ncbi:MAG: TMEM175 family protein [Actinomycetota bacterium]